jgi:hypothetical protein
MSELSDFMLQHWVVSSIATSLLWFFAGKQFFSEKKNDLAILWQCVAVMLILFLCGWAIVKGEWLGLLVAIGVFCTEVQSIRHASASGDQR